MATQPEVTVIIAAYNRSPVLRYAIESVLQQTFTNFELLVIGDACTDDSADVVQSFADNRVHWQNLPVNTGSQAGPNTAGLQQAQGRYIAYLGQDDLWLPHHCETVLPALRTGADVAYGLVVKIGPRGVIRGIYNCARPYTKDLELVPSVTMHTKALADTLGNRWSHPLEVTRSIDKDWWLRAKDAGAVFRPVHRITALKFPTSTQKDAYRQGGNAHHQDYWLQRLLAEPDVAERELQLQALISSAEQLADLRKPVRNTGWQKSFTQNKPSTSFFHQQLQKGRQFKGLDPL